MSVVLDTSAAIAFLRGEPGAENVAAALDDATIVAPIAAEIVAILMRYGSDASSAMSVLHRLGVPIVPMTADLALATGRLIAATRPLGLSLADCSCLALAIEQGAEVLSADRQWAKANLPVRITLIR
ncbi:MAG: type II toxin-antitoxin system VapC family toxin [Micropepsaceae bacterium]